MDYGDYLAGILRERVAERLEKETDNDRKDERAMNDDSTLDFPEHWPPRPGDLWEADGTTWHAFCPRLDVIRLESSGSLLSYTSAPEAAGWKAHVNQRGCLEEFAKRSPVLKYRAPAVTGDSEISEYPEHWPPQDGDVWDTIDSLGNTADWHVAENAGILGILSMEGILRYRDRDPFLPPVEDFLKRGIGAPSLVSRRAKPELPEHWPPQAGDRWEADGKTWTVREHSMVPGVIVVEDASGTTSYGDDAAQVRARLISFARLNPVLKYRQDEKAKKARNPFLSFRQDTGTATLSGTARKALNTILDEKLAKETARGESKPDPRLEVVASVLNQELSGKDKDGYIREVSGEILAALDTADRKAKGNYIPELAQLRKAERALRDALTQAVNDLSRAEQALAVMENAAAGPPARGYRDTLRTRSGSLLASGTQVEKIMKDFQHAAKEITQ